MENENINFDEEIERLKKLKEEQEQKAEQEQKKEEPQEPSEEKKAEEDYKYRELVLEKVQTEAYAKAKAESETQALADIVVDTNKTLQTKLNSKLAQHIDTNQEVAEKIEKTASKLVDKGLEVQENKATANIIDSEDEILTADFEKYKDEYLYHGIDHKIDKKWKKTLVLAINNIWFVIWAIVSLFTIVPVSTFLSRIKALSGFIRAVAVTPGVLLLLGCLFGATVLILRQCGINIF